ncbi:MAG: peptidase M17 [bacterium]|nr:peptidase M17 [bacterium]
MTPILLNNKVTEPSHILVLTEKFRNEFNLPEKVTDYFEAQFKKDEAAGTKGKKGTLSYNYIGKTILIVFVDKSSDKNKLHEQLRKHGAAMADAVNHQKGKEIYIYNQTRSPNLSLYVAEGIALANYQFIRHQSKSVAKQNSLQTVILANTKINAAEVHALNCVCEATYKARDLVNEPVNVLNAKALAGAFVQMGKEAGFRVEVLNKEKIKKLKMGGLLAVNAGSVDEPSFTVMEYKPRGAKNKKPYVLVGKGVVYDTGGLSLKPTPNSMDLMKCDMAGGAAVGAALYAIAKANLKVHVIGLVPATDNRPGFNAFAPGDIITMMDGSTVEMLNSDAEGRMILADALHYAKRFAPELTIDIATLTGAAAAAIGSSGIVGMGNASAKQKQALHKSSFHVHERIAEFPFWEDYDELLKSDIADQKNLGGPYAGAITAGRFLVKYTNYPYYHLDIAGPAFLTTKDSYRGKGGTGVGVRLFFDLISNL